MHGPRPVGSRQKFEVIQPALEDRLSSPHLFGMESFKGISKFYLKILTPPHGKLVADLKLHTDSSLW